MTTERRILWAVCAVLAILGYVTLGLGYHGLQNACYDSRHSIDHEPPVGGGAVGVAVDIVFWPLFLPFSGQQSCLPVPVGTGG